MGRRKKKRVGLGLSWSFYAHIENVLGALDYAAQHAKRWQLLHEHGDPILRDTKLTATDFDGLVVNIVNDKDLELFRRLDRPVVRVDNIVNADDIPGVFSDDRAVGIMAAEYFMQRKHESFAVITYPDEPYGQIRARAFIEKTGSSSERILEVSDKWDEDTYTEAFESFLRELEPPVAIFAINDELAVSSIYHIRKLGFKIPDEISVLGAWNDDYICCKPLIPLSSIKLPDRRCGYLAADMLDKMMDGKSVHTILLPPEGVASRASTDFFNVKDSLVLKALRYMHAHKSMPLHVANVATGINVNRRTLERRFRAEMGCSPLDEIMRLRLELAKEKLAFSRLTIAQVAHSSGFHDLKGLLTQFVRREGMSPEEYRAQHSIFRI